ncbi:primosomal protein N', partial [Candidatus Falkowbacteria bacterium]|nr:primosomal protein N' [Candidatus Falkowbacteria bacterium]
MSADAAFAPGAPVAVLTAEPLGRPLDYRAPEGGCTPGAFVEVPLGPRRVLGVVWGPALGGFDPARLRGIARVLDVAPMREELRAFLTRAADYTLTPLPAMLRLATRAPGLFEPPGTRRIFQLGSGTPDRMTDARERVLAVLRDHGGAGFVLGELATLAGVTPQVVKGLIASGAVIEAEAPRDLPFPRLDPALPGKALSEDQAAGAEALCAAVRSGRYGTTLLK